MSATINLEELSKAQLKTARLGFDKQVYAAAREYLALQSGEMHPQGRKDNAGRWYPKCAHPCCQGIRSPSRQWPWSLNKHARTADHVAHSHGIPERLLQVKSLAQLLKKCPLLRSEPVLMSLLARQDAEALVRSSETGRSTATCASQLGDCIVPAASEPGPLS